MISEFNNFYCSKRHLIASSMVLSYKTNGPKIHVSLVGFKGPGVKGIFNSKIYLNTTRVGTKNIEEELV